MELLPSLFSCVYSRVKLFVFAMNSRRRYSIFVCFTYGLEEKNSKSKVIFAVCRLPLTSCLPNLSIAPEILKKFSKYHTKLSYISKNCLNIFYVCREITPILNHLGQKFQNCIAVGLWKKDCEIQIIEDNLGYLIPFSEISKFHYQQLLSKFNSQVTRIHHL